MLGLSASLETELGLTAISDRHLVRSSEDLSGTRNAHSLRRAWKEIGLSAILFVDNQATVYFREVEEILWGDIRRYQRIVWNQGIATILLVSTETEIYVFSGQAPPASEDEDWEQNPRWVTTLKRTSNALEVKQLICRIETGLIYKEHPDSFDCEQAIDAHLLKNLGEVAKQLGKITPKLPLARINSLLGRVIFVCYLVDREIINKNLFATLGADGAGSLREVFENLSATESIKFLYRLFDTLQEKFNGSLFDEDFAAEERELTERHIDLLKRFLQGEDLQSGQTSFDFWAYDFNFIPIETISAIYEMFLGAEEQTGRTAAAASQRTSGAYYTPKHLAELVLDTATENGSGVSSSALLDKKVLDPACGSGIFLVSIFNRMAEEWLRGNPNAAHKPQWDSLVKILQTQLFGIDKNETACRITCFSLYLALLDQFDPRDIQKLAEQQKLLPTLLLKQDEPADSNSPRTILCRNFFGKDFPQGLQKCDLIVGNPPWIGRNQPPDRDADAWYKKHVKQPIPNRQIAHAFMWKCPHHLSNSGRVCLVLPSTVFLNNKTNKFQQRWFEHHRVEEVLQLADLRFMLFKAASCPACVVRYRIVANPEKNYSFNYISPQASHSDPRRGAVVITPNDHRRLQSAEVIDFAQRHQAPSLWKMFLRGTPRDIRLLERLMDYPRLDEIVGKPDSDKRWKSGRGFEPDSSGKAIVPDSQTKPKLPWWDVDHRFVEARKGMDFILLKGDYRNIGGDHTQLRRSPDRRIFQAPLVLVARGFTEVAFVDFDVLFRDSFQSIAGEQKDEKLLVFLCATLRSKLAKYFLFHTTARWGVERDTVYKYELLRLPFFPPDHAFAPSGAEGIVSQVHSIFTKAAGQLSQSTALLNKKNIIKKADKDIEPLIFAYFDCDEFEQILVRDTCQIIDSATPGTLNKHIPTLEPPTREQRKEYSNTICQVMNEWGKRSPIFISAASIVSPQTGLGIIVLRQTQQAEPPKDDEADERLMDTLAELSRNLPQAYGMRTYMRGLTVFEGETITIIKPLALRFWTKSAALNDADSLASAILTAKERPHQ